MKFRLRFERLWLSAAILALLPALGLCQITPEERKGLNDALYIGNLTEQDLRFEKKATDDPYRLPLNQLALDDPIQATDRMILLHANGAGSLYQALAAGFGNVYGDLTPDSEGAPILGPLPDEVPEDLKESLEVLLGAIDESNKTVHQALSKLTPGEARELIEGLPTLCAGSKQVKFGFTKLDTASQDRLFGLLAKVDLAQIRSASGKLAGVVEQQMPQLKALSKSLHLEKSLRFVIHGYRVEVSTEDDAIHTSRDTNLCLSFGDRNRFTGRFGAGIGYASVLMDLGSSSYYDVPDMSVGAGVLGVGLAYLSGQGDVFKGGSVCFGAGIAGTGAMFHEGNDASYRATALAEGFGSFGIGVLLDTGDRVNASVALYGQGASRTQGLGWMICHGSDATLTAGGLVAVDGRGSYLAASQGFSSGFGSDDTLTSGGVGLVTTFGTNETYVGGIRCQGAANFGGVGSIFDQGARGSHIATQESQGYANHQAASFVFNFGGYNAYTTKVGTCQGCASDYSVSVVLDRGGHDLYSAKDCRPATALSKGLALFLNSGAENSFIGRPASAVSSHNVSSLGLFCDLGANTRFSSETGLAPVRVDQNLAVFFQAVNATGEGVDLGSREQRFKSGSEANPGEAQLSVLWDRAKQSGPAAIAARQRLISIGSPSAEFIYRTELGAWNPSASAAIADVIAGIGDDARKILCLDIESSDPVRTANALRVACLAPGKGLEPALKVALTKPSLQRLAAQAAGLCQTKETVGQLLPLCGSSDAILALNALVALEEIGDPSAAGTASALLTSKQWPLRRVAVAVIAKFPTEAITSAAGLLASANEQDQRTGVDVLAAMDSPEGYRRLGHLLAGASPGVTLQALLGLQGHIPAELRAQVSALQISPNVLVKRVAEGIQVDR